MDLEEKIYRLGEIGIALSSERNQNRLLEKILLEARTFANAEGSSLYIREGDKLKFIISQNVVLSSDSSQQAKCQFHSTTLDLSHSSIAGHVAIDGEILNIPDVYHLPADVPYSFNKKFDVENDYRTKSMLTVPMKDFDHKIVGVLALINARDEQNQVVSFRSEYEPLILSLSSQAGVALKNIQLTQDLEDAYLDTVIRLAFAAECREPNIGEHLRRMSAYCEILAEEMKMTQKEMHHIKYASPMHDVGKIGIPDSILLKAGKLTAEEYEVMKKHTIFGARILARGGSELLKLSEKIALTHHEKYDGTGYPYGLKGEDIPIEGRIVALADVFDALASKRCYKNSWEKEKVAEYIIERSGSHFDPYVVKAFQNRIRDFFDLEKTLKYDQNFMKFIEKREN
jgi:response regulator RpfG family c-di-GMP phosphodiesterase